SRVKSTSVGRRPPEISNRSQSTRHCNTASEIWCRLSFTTCFPVTVTPRLFSSRVRKSELVSILTGVSISEPIAMICAVGPVASDILTDLSPVHIDISTIDRTGDGHDHRPCWLESQADYVRPGDYELGSVIRSDIYDAFSALQ